MNWKQKPGIVGKIAVGNLTVLGFLMATGLLLKEDTEWISILASIIVFPVGLGGAYLVAPDGLISDWKGPLVIMSFSVITNAYLWGFLGSRIYQRTRKYFNNASKRTASTRSA